MTSSWNWVLLFRTEGPKLVRFLRRFGAAVSPEDVAQESFARLFAAEPRNVISPRAFLFRTARNLAIDQMRRERAAPVRPSEHLVAAAVSPLASPEEGKVAEEECAALEAAIAALPERERLALLMRRVDNLSPEEIGAQLGLSPRQVRRLIAQALAAIAAALAATGDSGPDPR